MFTLDFAGGMFYGMMRSQAARARGAKLKYFDFEKAAKIIREYDVQNARACLIEDSGYTTGDILRDGAPVSQDDSGAYLVSYWATPVIMFETEDDYEELECYYEESKDHKHEWWSQAALDILNNVIESTAREKEVAQLPPPDRVSSQDEDNQQDSQ